MDFFPGENRCFVKIKVLMKFLKCKTQLEPWSADYSRQSVTKTDYSGHTVTTSDYSGHPVLSTDYSGHPITSTEILDTLY